MITSVLLLMQFVVSAKAGFVNYVDGTANVRRQQQVQASMPIQTQAASHVELLLSPGSFLRVGENSVVVLDSVELSDIQVRVVSGTAIVESATLNKDFPIHVSTGSVRVSVVAPGLYRFSGDSASVLNGKLRDDATGSTIKKGQEVIALVGGNQVGKVQTATADELDAWSQMRTGDLAKANLLAYRDRSAVFYNSYADYATFGMYPLNAAWLYSPFLSGFTFLPFQSYRSVYGYSFVPITGFGFTPFVPAANRPVASQHFPTQAFNGTQAAQAGAPAGNPPLHRPGAGTPNNPANYTHWNGGAGHAPIHAGANSGGTSPAMHPGANTNGGGGNGGFRSNGAGASAGGGGDRSNVRGSNNSGSSGGRGGQTRP